MNLTTKGTNINTYTLFKGKVDSFEIAYVRCYCPSTDRMFFLGVNPSHISAKDAIASLCQVPSELVVHVESINRQGEIFSINFDVEGIELLESEKVNLSPENRVSLTGQMYFDKLKYEY